MFSNTGKLCLKLFKISCEEIPLFFDWKAEYSNPGQCPKKSIELYLKRQKLWIDPIHFIICFLREVYSQKTGTGGWQIRNAIGFTFLWLCLLMQQFSKILFSQLNFAMANWWQCRKLYYTTSAWLGGMPALGLLFGGYYQNWLNFSRMKNSENMNAFPISQQWQGERGTRKARENYCQVNTQKNPVKIIAKLTRRKSPRKLLWKGRKRPSPHAALRNRWHTQFYQIHNGFK